MTSPPKPPLKIKDIEFLRGIAILLVLIYHFSFSATIFSAVSSRLSLPFYIGVDLFFMISGFVVTNSLMRSGMEPIAFLIKRVFRLFPVLLAGLALGEAVNIFYRYFYHNEWAVSFFTVQWREFLREAFAILSGRFNLSSGPTSYSNGAMWSLSVEFQFYAIVFFLLVAISVGKLSPSMARRIFTGAVLGILGLCLYARLIEAFALRAPGLTYLIHYRFDFMATGVALALFKDQGAALISEKIRPLAPFLLLMPLVVLAFLHSQLMTPAATAPDYLDSWGFLITEICFVPIVLLAIQNRLVRQRSKLYHVLTTLGEYSYVIYVIHFGCMALGWGLLVRINVSLASQPWVFAIAQPLATLVFLAPGALIVHRFVEMPLNGLGHRLASKISAKPRHL